MLALRFKAPSIYSLFSQGNFVEHLTGSKLRTFCYAGFNPNAAISSASASPNSYFEALTSHQKEQIHLYVDALLEWNQKMNLTATKEANEVMERHIEDSLSILPPLQNSYGSNCKTSCDNLRIVDVGSGAGLPGMVLAIACPGWEVTLLESMNKRCIFLEHAISLTGLSNVRIVRERAEVVSAPFIFWAGDCRKVNAVSRHYHNLGQDVRFREKFDIAVARAVAEMRILAEYCLPLVHVGGLFVAAKGHDPHDEVRRAEKAIKVMGASILQLCSVESQSPYGQRTAIICSKDRSTPAKYPRDPGIPAKDPV